MKNAGDIAVELLDRWAWYQKALANPVEIGVSIPVHENEPQQGYYRVKNDDGGLDPVAIFYPEDSDELVAYRSNREIDPFEIWTHACRRPVTYEAYQKAVDGGGWDDDDPTVAAQIASTSPGIGDNSGEIDDAEVLRDQIEAAEKGADAYAKISDDKTLAKAQSLRSRLLELRGEAVKRHKKEKEPHLDAGRAVDKKWFPLRDRADDKAKAIRDAMDAWENEKLRKRREAERKAEQERLKAEEEAKRAAEAGKPAPSPEPAHAPVDHAPAPIKGTYGKAASVQVKQVVTDVTDWTALSAYMIEHPELRDLLKRLAQRAVDAGRTVPGVIVEEQAKVR